MLDREFSGDAAKLFDRIAQVPKRARVRARRQDVSPLVRSLACVSVFIYMF